MPITPGLTAATTRSIASRSEHRAWRRFSLWYNNLPPKGTATCYLSPVRALPVAAATLRNPTVNVGGREFRFPVAMETGQYLEFRGVDDCRLYGKKGEEICQVVPVGDVPTLDAGENEIQLSFDTEEGAVAPRAHVTVITQGAAFGGKNPPDAIREEFLLP